MTLSKIIKTGAIIITVAGAAVGLVMLGVAIDRELRRTYLS